MDEKTQTNECEWDIIKDICQKALRRNGTSNDNVKENSSKILKDIREKNRTNTTLLGSTIEEKEYSEEFIKQCEKEFKTFVKPIRDKVVGRMLGEK